LLTLQEEPPTCEIYKDNSYKFSKSLASMIEKCLKKDPSKRYVVDPTVFSILRTGWLRLSAAKLLEHKFFKKARDNGASLCAVPSAFV